MSEYLLTWVTKNLAVGHAPTSYADFDSIQHQGIDAIVNLCAEFSDLHELEEAHGFEVFYLPIPDEHAPSLKEMEKGLEWLDEAIYLGKKILVHCNHGIGRTGTFVIAYLLRRGLGMKKAEKAIKATRANPSNFSQWWLLRKFGKKEGTLKIEEASPENNKGTDLSEYYARYEELLRKVDKIVKTQNESSRTMSFQCGETFSMQPIESLYLSNRVNITLTAQQRKDVMEKGAQSQKMCPLYADNNCLLFRYRPIACRIHGLHFSTEELDTIQQDLSLLSKEISHQFFNPEKTLNLPLVDRSEVISGKFIQKYFQYLSSQLFPHERENNR